MKTLILTFILLTSSTYASTCTDYFHPFRIMRVEDLSEAEYDILETIARFEIEARTTLDAPLRNSRLADLNTHFEYLAQLKIDPAVYYEILESVYRNESSKIKDRKKRIQELKIALELEKIQELEAQKIIEPIIQKIKMLTSLKGDSLQSLFDQALAIQTNPSEQGIVFEVMEPIFKSENEYVRRKISTESKNKALEVAIHTNSSTDSSELAKDLLDFGADPNATATHGMTMLIYAVLLKKPDIAQILIEYKANTNAVFQSNSILHIAIETGGDHRNLQLLLQNGANVHATNKDGETPLHFAAKTNMWGLEPLLKHRANVHATNKDGETPLHSAVKSGSSWNTYRLLGQGANVHAKNKDGETPLHFAVESGNPDIILNLIGDRADPNAKNNRGETPLYRAVLKEKEEAVRYLVHISDKYAASLTGQTPLQIANSKGYSNKNIQYLLKHSKTSFGQHLNSVLNQIKNLGKTLRKLTTPSNQKKP